MATDYPMRHVAGFFSGAPENIDFTDPSFGDVAAAILYTNNGRSGGADQNAVRGTIGFWIRGNFQRCVGHSHNNANSTIMRGSRNMTTDRISTVYNNTGGGPQMDILATAITDGIQLQVLTTDAPRYYFMILFSETDIAEVALGTTAVDSGSMSTGFQADAVFTAHVGMNTLNAPESTEASMGFGMATNSLAGGTEQRCMYQHLLTGDAPLPSTGANIKSATSLVAKCNTSTINFRMSVAAWNPTAIITSLSGSSSNNYNFLAIKWKGSRVNRAVANNIVSGLTTKTNNNFGFPPKYCLSNNVGSGTGQDSVRTSNVTGWSFWGNEEQNTKGGYIRTNTNVIPSVTASAGNTVRGIHHEYDNAGQFETTATRLIADGIEWDLTNSLTQNTWGMLYGVSVRLSNVFLGDENVPRIYIGGNAVSKVYLGNEVIYSENP